MRTALEIVAFLGSKVIIDRILAIFNIIDDILYGRNALNCVVVNDDIAQRILFDNGESVLDYINKLIDNNILNILNVLNILDILDILDCVKLISVSCCSEHESHKQENYKCQADSNRQFTEFFRFYHI